MPISIRVPISLGDPTLRDRDPRRVLSIDVVLPSLSVRESASEMDPGDDPKDSL